MPTVPVERRKRGAGGRICLVLFWIWQVLMALFSQIGQDINAHQGQLYEDSAGTVLGTWFLLLVWGAGSVITGALAFFTRGPRRLVRMDVPDAPPLSERFSIESAEKRGELTKPKGSDPTTS
jgi:hypothetical protein